MLQPQTMLLARYMDLLAARQQATAANIANADTPGYRTRDIDFAFELARAVDGPQLGQAGPIRVQEAGGLPVKNDGNDVSLERELRIAAETGIRFGLASMMLRKKIEGLRSAIHEGRRG